MNNPQLVPEGVKAAHRAYEKAALFTSRVSRPIAPDNHEQAIEAAIAAYIQSTGAAPQVPTDTTLWCVNITGPDDVFPVASRAEAVTYASRFNDYATQRFEKNPNPYSPLMWAVPTQWPHDADLHAASLGQLGEYEWLRDLPDGSTGAVAPERLTPELRAKIEAVRAGCEGVPSGPWSAHMDDYSLHVERGPYIPDNYTLALCATGTHAPKLVVHLSRLDPNFVRQLCDLATHPAPADTGQGGRVDRDTIAEAINKARYVPDGLPYRTLAQSDRMDNEYAYRLADGVLAALYAGART